MEQELLSELGRIEMNVNLGCGNRLVTEHLLNSAKVGSTLEEMGSETMAECMRGYILANTRCFGELLHDIEDHHSRKSATSAIKEKDIFFAGLNVDGIPIFEISAYSLYGARRNGNNTLLGSFSLDDGERIAGRETRDSQVAEFRHSDSAAIEHFHNCAVAVGFIFIVGNSGNHSVDLFDAEHVGERPFGFRAFEEDSGILCDDIFGTDIFIK